MMNNKGFTLVEILVVLVLLGLVVSIAGYSIVGTMNSANDELYNQLISNIKDGAEMYYQECKYGKTDAIVCVTNGTGFEITLGDMVSYGYLAGNSKSNTGQFAIINPKSKNNIGSCKIKVIYSSGSIQVSNLSTGDGNCPSEY